MDGASDVFRNVEIQSPKPFQIPCIIGCLTSQSCVLEMPPVKLCAFLWARLCPNLKNCLMQATARFPSCVFWLIGRCGCVLKDRFNSANCHSMVLYIKALILCLWFWISDFDTTPEKLVIILELLKKKNFLCLRDDSWKNQITGKKIPPKILCFLLSWYYYHRYRQLGFKAAKFEAIKFIR